MLTANKILTVNLISLRVVQKNIMTSLDIINYVYIDSKLFISSKAYFTETGYCYQDLHSTQVFYQVSQALNFFVQKRLTTLIRSFTLYTFLFYDVRLCLSFNYIHLLNYENSENICSLTHDDITVSLEFCMIFFGINLRMCSIIY